MNNNKNIFKILLFLFVILCSCSMAQALQIVYPKSPNTQINAESTFFVGNTKPGSVLTINEKPVKVFENGAFVEVVPLKDGFNRIVIDSKNETEHDIMTYIIKKESKAIQKSPEVNLVEFPANEYIYASVVKNNTPLRAQPDEYAQRITHLDSNTVLMINGKKGDYFRVALTPEKNVWVRAENVVCYSTINEKMFALVNDVSVSSDKLYEYIKTPLSFQVPFKVSETLTGLTLELYNIKNNPSDTKLFESDETIKNLAINNVSSENKSTYFIELQNKLWGYDVYYENNCLVLKIRKAPQIDTNSPLKGLTFLIDAGHGGSDYGAVGPTGIKEKDINLDISQKLKNTLEQKGANVIMTRTDDSDLGLYERVKIAKKSDALVLLSIHANSLKDGANPYEKHGTSVFFYNAEAAELSKTLRNTLTQDLGMRDDGVCKMSLVLTRPTMPLSVLIEVAYMINPDEYALLIKDEFRQKTAESITKGLEIYIIQAVKNSLSSDKQ